jgi:flagellar operon protein
MADSFQVQLEHNRPAAPQAAAPQATAPQATRSNGSALKPVSGPSFAETLASTQDVRFSNHAQKRMQSRDIQLSDENVNRLSNAIDKAEKRGGKSSLVMVDDLAFIVNVRDRTVVTALDTNQRGEGVFNQIDSVVFADPAGSKPVSTVDRQG